GLNWTNGNIPAYVLNTKFADIGFFQSNHDFFENHEAYTDQFDGLHVFTGVYMWDTANGDDTTNYFHFYNPTPDDENSWIINHVTDITQSSNYDYDGQDAQQFLFPGISFSNTSSNVIWFVCNKVSAFDENGYTDIDIYLYRSEDFGSSWLWIGNLTNTTDGHHIESYIHAAPLSTDNDITFMYAIPDLDVQTNPDDFGYPDYKQLIYFGHYQGEDFELGDNSLVITEIMQNPSAVNDEFGEWFEIYNDNQMAVSLTGYKLKDSGTDIHVIEGNLFLLPNSYIVLGNNEDLNTNGGVSIDYQYADISLGN
ncbi:uncharacterized protein METZ01_LOCUS364345, partial [marine metagenome]